MLPLARSADNITRDEKKFTIMVRPGEITWPELSFLPVEAVSLCGVAFLILGWGVARPLGYERVYVPLHKVADTSFHTQGEQLMMLFWAHSHGLSSYFCWSKLSGISDCDWVHGVITKVYLIAYFQNLKPAKLCHPTNIQHTNVPQFYSKKNRLFLLGLQLMLFYYILLIRICLKYVLDIFKDMHIYWWIKSFRIQSQGG